MAAGQIKKGEEVSWKYVRFLLRLTISMQIWGGQAYRQGGRSSIQRQIDHHLEEQTRLSQCRTEQSRGQGW